MEAAQIGGQVGLKFEQIAAVGMLEPQPIGMQGLTSERFERGAGLRWKLSGFGLEAS